jgi:hypothetical protein
MANRHSPNVSNVRSSIVSAIRTSLRETLTLAIRSRDVRVQGVPTGQVCTHWWVSEPKSDGTPPGDSKRSREPKAAGDCSLFVGQLHNTKTRSLVRTDVRVSTPSERRGPLSRWRRREPVRSDERVNRQSRRNSLWTRWLFHVHVAAASTTTCAQRAGVASSLNRATRGVGRFLICRCAYVVLRADSSSVLAGARPWGRLGAYASTSW